jgi:hypothetical protein
MSKDVTYLHIRRAIEKKTECFLCALEDEIERRYIDSYLSELVMENSMRQRVVESRGFCNSHSYKMLIAASKPESPDGHGMALTMENVLEQLIQDLHKLGSGHAEDFHQMPKERKCPACAYLAEFMEMYHKDIALLLWSRDEDFLRLLEDSKGLCIPHFSTLTHVVVNTVAKQSRGIVETVTEVEERNLSKLVSGLSEYVRRQSYEFSDRDRAAVEDVLLRSVEKIVGRRGVSLSYQKWNSASMGNTKHGLQRGE